MFFDVGKLYSARTPETMKPAELSKHPARFESMMGVPPSKQDWTRFTVYLDEFPILILDEMFVDQTNYKILVGDKVGWISCQALEDHNLKEIKGECR